VLVVVSSAMLVHAAAAYVGQNPYAVHLDGPPGVVGCRSEVVITATVRGAETGDLVSNQVVEWDITTSRSTDDSLSSRISVTGPDGKASVTLAFGPVEGARNVRAMIATWPATIAVTCRGGVPLPTATPTGDPTATPSTVPSTNPSVPPTVVPTVIPSIAPSASALPATPPASAPPDTVPTVTPTASANSGPVAADTNAPDSAALSSLGRDLMLALVVVVLVLGLGTVVLVRATARR
jgi:hypothetical protein